MKSARTFDDGPPSARDKALAATLALIASEGIDAVTHRRVAEAAGISLGSTTHHFSSRTDLLCETFRHHMEQLGGVLRQLERAAAPIADPLARLRQVIGALVAREFGAPTVVRAEYEMLLFASTHEELANDARAWEDQIVAHIAVQLEEAGANKPFGAARTIVNLVRGYELERLLRPDLDEDELYRRLDPVLAALAPT